MAFNRLLIANRGEIAIRIARAAANLGISTIGIYSKDDASALHTQHMDNAIEISKAGVPAYLDAEQIAQAALNEACDAVHPGYGFLAEDAEFAQIVRHKGLTFVGPNIEALRLFGNKSLARRQAESLGVPVLLGTSEDTSLAHCQAFFRSLPSGRSVMLKAAHGGGGRGMRRVDCEADLESAFARCRSEAKSAFGSEELFIEECVTHARHIEVQILGDAHRHIIHFGTRECSLQRRRQKLIEIAPAPYLDKQLEGEIIDAAMTLARSVDYSSLGTFEFLLDPSLPRGFAFIEANARVQVEHTVTEEVTGVDLVEAQLNVAAGLSLDELGLSQEITPQGHAIELRINAERYDENGEIKPSVGQITAYARPGGPGIRIDDCAEVGYAPNPNFDTLIAKLIASSRAPNIEALLGRAGRALDEFRIEGIDTNRALLAAIIKDEAFVRGEVHTEWLDERLASLLSSLPKLEPTESPAQLAGAQVSSDDPLAVFNFDRAQQISEVAHNSPSTEQEGEALYAPIQGTVLEVLVESGQHLATGTTLVLIEAMKMEHEIKAMRPGHVTSVAVRVGDVVAEGSPLVFLRQSDVETQAHDEDEQLDLDHIRDDLAEVFARHAFGLDDSRPEAVAKRRKTGQRTARENLADLCDEGTFVEYGPLVLAAQRRRRSIDWLRANTPGDGVVMGLGQVNGHLFESSNARCALLAYDYTVLAGTQGVKNHYKQDRLFHLAERHALPIVMYTEGGGGRPGDTDTVGGLGMDVFTFTQWSKLSGLVPMVGINSGYCFAGNTALLGCCDVVIATKKSNIGMGGPAMIEGGGLGIFSPREIGPMSMQVANGVVDVLADDEADATRLAKQYLSYFQGTIKEWQAPDQRRMRHLVPENRKRIYQVRDVINTLADEDSVLELREGFGVGIITALIRIEGRPLGLIANNAHHLSGAIDSDAADKAARFLQLCDAFDLPIVSLMDCPGIMVGPEVEKTALVRHCCRLFNTGANLTVPIFGIILRKAYGLGVQAMCGGSSMVPLFVAAWPTAEFAGMNIEGSIKLAYRSDFAAIEDAEARRAKFDEMVAEAYDRAKAVNAASFFGVDDVIDPATSRDWIVAGLNSLPPTPERHGKKRPNVDTW
ncbi:MAG: carbamoyl-phosphate synthase large subunit [Gammaproteobacteria bacterium]|nr:carbamoyl-phosphate synthase large subunit [Gammaproteobacteria bacterium]